MFTRISHKLAASYLGMILLMLLVFIPTFNRMYGDYNRRNLQDELIHQSFSLSQTLTLTLLLEEENGDRLGTIAGEFREQTGARVTVVDLEGRVLAETERDRLEMGNHLDREELVEARLTGLGVRSRFSETLGEDYLYVARPVYLDGQIQAYVRISRTLAEVNRIPRSLRILEWTSLLAASLVALLAGLYFSRRLSRPLGEMSRAVDAIRQGDFGIRVYPGTRDELSVLARGINQMAGDLKNTLERVEQVKEELEDVLNNLNNAVVLLDREGRVRLMNSMASRLFGRDREESRGQHNLQVLRDYRLDRAFRKAVKEKRLRSMEVKVYLPEQKILEAVLIPVLDEDRVDSVVISFHDVTEIVRAETVRTEFVANASHELKTPLTAIRGFTETLLDGALDDRETAVRFLKIIDSETARLNRLAEDLLNLARLEDPGILMKMQPVELGKICSKILKQYGKLAQTRGVLLECLYPEDLPPVQGDPDWLSQVIINLVDNAIKYIGKGTRVRVEAGMEEEFVRIRVSDDGIGIPEDDRKRIFERFYRVDRDRSRDYGGTGLGLSIVKHVVESHGGAVGVEESPEGGSVFWFTIPVAGEREDGLADTV